MRCFSRLPVQSCERKITSSLAAENFNPGIKGNQGLGKIAWISCDTLIAGSQNGMRAVKPIKCCASRAWPALVAIFV